MASTAVTTAAAAAAAPNGGGGGGGQQQLYQQPLDAAPGPIYVDTQHEDLVHDAQMDYYGSKLATCSSGTFVCVCVLGAI
jgi:hypothetical protein